MTRSRLRTDNDGNAYIGISIGRQRVRPFLKALQKFIGPKAYRVARDNKIKRDGAGFHLTVVAPPEMRAPGRQQAFSGPARVRLIGLGSARKGQNTIYFIIAECAAAVAFRRETGLPAKDLHVTLAFNRRDIHSISKARNTLVDMKSRARGPTT